jgi:DNA-directed RNA polymerase subunit RPC12/RpoP
MSKLEANWEHPCAKCGRPYRSHSGVALACTEPGNSFVTTGTYYTPAFLPKEEGITCPACGHEQIHTVECAACGKAFTP